MKTFYGETRLRSWLPSFWLRSSKLCLTVHRVQYTAKIGRESSQCRLGI